jgi:hypothetical protein
VSGTGSDLSRFDQELRLANDPKLPGRVAIPGAGRVGTGVVEAANVECSDDIRGDSVGRLTGRLNGMAAVLLAGEEPHRPGEDPLVHVDVADGQQLEGEARPEGNAHLLRPTLVGWKDEVDRDRSRSLRALHDTTEHATIGLAARRMVRTTLGTVTEGRWIQSVNARL